MFLTGQQEIETASRLLHEAMDAIRPSSLKAFPVVKHLSILPLYSALDTADQKEVFKPARLVT